MPRDSPDSLILSRGFLVEGSSMVPTCDRCRVRAVISYRRATSVWNWCQHHAREYHPALTRLGYTRQTIEAMAASG